MSIENTPPANSGNGQDTPPKFELLRYNPRRKARCAEAAKIRCTWGDGSAEELWMCERDIRANIKWYGPCQAFTDALDAYKKNIEVENPTTQTDAPASSTSPAAPAIPTQPKETE